MKKTGSRWAAAVVLLLGVAGLVAAQSIKPAVDATLADLSWMTGRWEGDAAGTSMEELWTDPRGGVMLGLHRDVSPAGRAIFEYLRIVEEEGGIAYMASPMGRPAIRFALVSAGASRAVFENPEHDFPRRITYWLGKDGKLHARVEGEEGGTPSAMEWAWSRMD